VLAAAPEAEGRRALTLLVERDGAVGEVTWPAWTRAELAAVLGDIAWTQAQGSAVIVAYQGEAGALGGLVDGDRVLSIQGEPVSVWSDIERRVRAAQGRDLLFRVERGGEEIERLITPAPGPLVDFGFNLETYTYVFRTASVGEAVRVGLASSFRFLQEVWLSLQKLILREVPADSLGGIIQISVVSYTWAESGVAKLFFFLCLLSINLAFINVLPIPVLDGGHLFFLGIEAVKGSPVSEKVFGYSQMVGLVLIVTLMVYVTFNDLMRLFQ
jgi:regulator of sigma E protease